MKSFRRWLLGLGFLAVLSALGYIFVAFYPYIFAREVHGLILSVDPVQLNASLMHQPDRVSPQLFSFAIAIREDTGEIVTASAEDRQWSAAQRGLCVEAVFYPYPPWKLMKAGNFFNARLDRLYECPEKAHLLPKLQESTNGSSEPSVPTRETVPAPESSPEVTPTN